MTRSIARLALPSAVALTALSMLFGPAALAAPGELDNSFGGDGRVSISPGGKLGAFNDVAVQGDGKIVLAGWAYANPGELDMAVTRLNADGSPDTGFGVGGTVLVNVVSLPTRADDLANAVTIQPDGKIVVAGTSPSGSVDLATVVRLLPSGTLDASFGAGGVDGDGIARPRAGVANDVAVDGAGRIVIAGTYRRIGTMVYDSFTERLSSAGVSDDTGGAVFDLGGNDGVARLALRPGGGTVVAGATDTGSGDAAIARTAGTALDPDFGVGGKFVYGFGDGSADAAEDLALEPDGRIDVAGYGGAADNFKLTRFTAGGTLDPSLNGNSTVDADFGGSDAANAIVLQASGKIVLAGGAENDIGVARFQPGGVPDATFGPGGKRTVAFPTESVAYAAALQGDGRIVLAGSVGTDNIAGAVVRLQGDSAGDGGGPGGPGGPGGSGGTTKVPRCGGKKATIVGTNKKNKLRGTKRADVIVGLGGNDTISGLGGNDRVCGGSGNDRVSGGSGNDRVYGDSGKDKVAGDSGKDQLHGGSGNDTVSGGAGNDSESGDSGNDRLAGGAGKDKLSGGSGKDQLNGNGSRDSLNGGSGKDRCAGTDRKKSC